MLDALLITRMHDEMTAALHEVDDEVAIEATADGLMALATAQHRANFDLWHEEDKARVPKVPDGEIVRVKRAIDSLNQRRNDLVEKMDLWLIDRLDQDIAAPLHSHTREESSRVNATEQHRRKNAERLVLLEEQRQDLAGCLDALWTEVLEGRRRFKLYRQMKMYNDPELNPAVYGRR
jgi:hypothetical protein